VSRREQGARGPSPRVIRTRKSLNTTRRLIPGAHEIPISLIVFIRAARDRDSAQGSAHLANYRPITARDRVSAQRSAQGVAGTSTGQGWVWCGACCRLERRHHTGCSGACSGACRSACSGACVRLSDRRAVGRSASSTTRTKGDCRRAQGQEGCGLVSRRCHGRLWEIVDGPTMSWESSGQSGLNFVIWSGSSFH
jgi:hypothetical protein